LREFQRKRPAIPYGFPRRAQRLARASSATTDHECAVSGDWIEIGVTWTAF
jgi:hypothetical protein